MSVHYYTDNQNLESQRHLVSYDFNGHHFEFTSDLGVFSKDAIDYGSRALMNSFDELHHQSILDVGCGYGVIGLSLLTLGEDNCCDFVDVNGRALELCTLNIQTYGNDNCHAFKSDGYENVEKTYDLIVSNPPIRAGKEVVHRILSGAYEHLKPQGHLRIVIQKKQGAPSAKKKMEEVFGNCTIINRDKGYYILDAIKQA